MKKLTTLLRGLLCLSLLCLLVGFFLAMSTPNNVFAGVTMLAISAVLNLVAIVPAVKLIKSRNMQTENKNGK